MTAGGWGRSRARSVLVTTMATPPSLSWQQSSRRNTGSITHRHRRLHHRACRRPAAVVHAAEERQVADADVPRDLDLVARIHGEGDHAVDVARLQPSVVDRGFHRLAGELELTATGLLGESGL